MLSMVDGLTAPPPTITQNFEVVYNPEYLAWKKKDQILLSWLHATFPSKVCASGALYNYIPNMEAIPLVIMDKDSTTITILTLNKVVGRAADVAFGEGRYCVCRSGYLQQRYDNNEVVLGLLLLQFEFLFGAGDSCFGALEEFAELADDHFMVEDKEGEICQVKIQAHSKEEEEELVEVTMEEGEVILLIFNAIIVIKLGI
ncbi:hypothetical protein POM88_045723 [Heracleum sosnowskyi]|uniref:Uncharacterized protein n=1 Tax=Heracleum sosnowskyi TaxID=360622 RepID=A0AAD8M6B2_9APIA|nr:hypothetical protein POM88_045723 [Heracleum sosnowskyi]